jgi:hypothetical protein
MRETNGVVASAAQQLLAYMTFRAKQEQAEHSLTTGLLPRIREFRHSSGWSPVLTG